MGKMSKNTIYEKREKHSLSFVCFKGGMESSQLI